MKFKFIYRQYTTLVENNNKAEIFSLNGAFFKMGWKTLWSVRGITMRITRVSCC